MKGVFKVHSWKIIISALLLGFIVFAGCKGKEQEQTQPQIVKVGVVGEQLDQWTPIVANLAKEGITVELVKFGDYVMPNQALADGDIDLNAFQHYAFLDNQIKDKGYQIMSIGDTFIAPLGLYSRKIKTLDELKNGDIIAIPSDPTNGGRSLKVLETAGLIKVDPAAGYVPELNDITENRLNLEFVEVEASQTAGLLPDVAAAIINGDHALDHGFFPARDAVYLEAAGEGESNPYVNLIAARIADKDNPLYKKVVDAYQTEEVRNIMNTVYNGARLPAW